MPKITAGTSVKAALLAAFPFLVGINGTEESLHEYLAIFVLLYCRAASVETEMVVPDDEVRFT